MNYLTAATLLSVTLLSCGGQRDSSQSDTTATDSRNDTLAPESEVQVFAERVERGIDFVATGNEPFWSLKIDLDGSMHFKALDGPEIKAPTPEGVKALDGDTTRYEAESEQGSIVAQLIKVECMDTMSGAKSEYTVRVEILAAANESPSTYEGCGRFLADMLFLEGLESGLHSKWMLESINDKALNAADFMKGLPELQFDLPGKRVMGHSGCNNIAGDIEVRGDTITFKPMIATKMACPGMEFENDYLKKLSGNVAYRVEDRKLHLRVSADSTFTYRKTN